MFKFDLKSAYYHKDKWTFTNESRILVENWW